MRLAYLVGIAGLVAASCGTEPPTMTNTAAPDCVVVSTGSVESATEVETEVGGDELTAGVAVVVGAVIGGFLFVSSSGAMFLGAVVGGATGAAIAPVGANPRAFDVRVRLDNGATTTVRHEGQPPDPGDRVAIVDGDLVPE